MRRQFVSFSVGIVDDDDRARWRIFDESNCVAAEFLRGTLPE